MIFVATKKGRQKNLFSHLSFVAVFGSGIRNGQKSESGIRGKHPGSETLPGHEKLMRIQDGSGTCLIKMDDSQKID